MTEAWGEGLCLASDFPILSCMESCRNKLEVWNMTDYGHVGKKIASLQKRLEWLELQATSPDVIRDLREMRVELNCWLDKEDAMWKQRARLNWFQEGDRNTRFFHARASSRFQKNLIEGIFYANEVWQVDHEEIEKVFIEYYLDLFTSSEPSEFAEIVEAVQPKVTQSMNAMLIREFHASEVHKALKQMYPLKAPGPDGMPPLFFQKFWPTVGGLVTKIVLDFLNLGTTPPKFNETHIVLIPKIKSPKRVTEFRPISLCNVIYKLASKTLANRLKKIIPAIISDTQSAFVNGRLITDNVLVAFETMHHINLKKTGTTGGMALKLDLSKAYDRVEWACLDKIMEKLGFHSRWRRLMMQCISLVTYAVCINGKPSDHIIPTRGLRQGDPLSPYLFMLCAEGLSALIKKSTADGLLEDISVSKGGPCLSHLFFANDSLIFCKATIEECDVLQRILSTYEKASGQ